MGFSCGIVGLPNAGKSTVFNALTASSVPAESYPFCTIDPNVGVVPVPDDRLEVVREKVGSPRSFPTVMEFVDIAGLVKGASKGEGLGNQFLSHIRGVDAIVQVVRCFRDPNVAHVTGSLIPPRDVDIVNIELILADLDLVERQLAKAEKALKAGNKKLAPEVEVLTRARDMLLDEVPLRKGEWKEEERKILAPYQLLTLKPLLYVANTDEEGLMGKTPYVEMLKEKAQEDGVPLVVLCGKLEAELAQLEPEEAREFRESMGLEESGLVRLIRAGYALLDLITFFTANEKEARAWTIKRGTRAPQAAGKVHSDMEKGFIKAEVISFHDLARVGSLAEARDKGLVRMEGKEYVVQDGDLIYFRFNI